MAPRRIPILTTMMRRKIILICALGTVAMSAGCSRSLFADYKSNLTQFDAYDRMRGDSKPMTVPGVFGTPQPALRERLSQPD